MAVNRLILSIFPGIDILGKGFEAEGYTVVRGPDVLWGGDVREFHPPAGVFEGVIGGPPCQPFSPLVNLMKAQGRKPRHPNLIPEYERIVAEAQPRFFVMEEVQGAPKPSIKGYTTHTFFLCPTWLGEEQRRKRMITFGLRGAVEIDLRQWIEYVALEVGEAEGAVYQAGVNNSDEAKGRVKVEPQLAGHGPAPGQRRKTSAVLASRQETPVKIGGSGLVKPHQTPPVGQHTTFAIWKNGRVKRVPVVGGHGPLEYRKGAVTGSDGGDSVRMHRYRHIEEMCRLQGLPENFFDEDTPFRKDAQRQLIANAVALPVARALAKAVKHATRQGSDGHR